MLESNRWIAHRSHSAPLRLRLFCFHHAGGAANVFRDWGTKVPKGVEVCPVQLPGHSTRMGEPLPTNLRQVISEAAVGLAPELTVPYVFLGHSLGALVAYELAHELGHTGKAGPRHLIAAARVAPSVAVPGSSIHALPDDDFIDALRTKYNAIPAEILRERELLQLLLPVMRADFRLHETYRYSARQPLSCGLSVYGGVHDDSVTEAHLLAWRLETNARFSKTMIPGDHFFIHAGRPEFTRAIAAELEAVIGQL